MSLLAWHRAFRAHGCAVHEINLRPGSELFDRIVFERPGAGCARVAAVVGGLFARGRDRMLMLVVGVDGASRGIVDDAALGFSTAVERGTVGTVDVAGTVRRLVEVAYG